GRRPVGGGRTEPATFGSVLALAQINADGSLDASFGRGGEVLDSRTTIGAAALAVQSDGKIVVSGRTQVGSNDRGFVERFNADGTADSGFANPGIATTPAGWTFQQVTALAFDPSRGIFIAGGDGLSLMVAHLTAGGQLDTSFGSGGIATASAGSGTSSTVSRMTIDPNRGLVVVGGSYGGTPAHFSSVLARFDFQGNLDSS